MMVSLVMIMAEKPSPQSAISFVGSNVTVNREQKGGIGGRVFVTPLPMSQQQQQMPFIPTSAGVGVSTALPSSRLQTPTRTPPSFIIPKLLLKAVSRSTKKSKVFTLRDINVDSVTSLAILKTIIKDQLANDTLFDFDFDVGYVQGANVVTIRNEKDLSDVWGDARKQGHNVVLWCDGLKDKSGKRKKKCEDGDSSEEEDAGSVKSKRKKSEDNAKEKAVAKTVTELQEKHGGTYTQIQYRIWSEMLNGGIYSSLINPPNTLMFQRAGGVDHKRNMNSSSQSKSVDMRSKCYKQLTELSALKSNGIITEEEYEREKKAIMHTLKEL